MFHYLRFMQKQTTTLGGGCFWCLEAVFKRVKGVEKVISGYSGGHVANPSYREVCEKTTGHAEVVQITFDSDVIGFDDLLLIFFHIHDPTTKDRQGNDVGPQYRSVIFYHDETQKQLSQIVINQLEKENLFSNPIVTEVTKFSEFFPAESEHRNYYDLNSQQTYCQFVIAPKISKFFEVFSDLAKEDLD